MNPPEKKTRILQMLPAEPHWFLITTIDPDGDVKKRIHNANRVIGWALIEEPSSTTLRYVTGLICPDGGFPGLPLPDENCLCDHECEIEYFWSEAKTTAEVVEEYLKTIQPKKGEPE